ncbi:DUF3306 domain-containing protein [Sediminicurvatus halobius]|uniref:DUF3306 domain-containing protein n=1 Tax=Sediminicurvatus halobius TaxID=2182432 RepID=A0A2U2MZI0_9GAMM|nr:DUF3306 domain-containing protein [Spiribacter halobius]PWG62218.1 hypothetical protein DEM34_12990 [Spiribacter halobius]UEX78126.1 DUF3306 domain-containing protein [Spiribacter halobius]
MARETNPEDRETGFLARWNQRKREVQREAGRPDPEPEAGAPEEAGSADEQAPALTDADMPALDSLDQDSDVSGFLSEGVSEDLRRQALRRLFHTPKFNLRDGLDDYDEDYRAMMTPLGDTVTHDLRRQRKRLEEREAERQEALADVGEPVGEPVGEDVGSRERVPGRGPAGDGAGAPAGEPPRATESSADDNDSDTGRA